MVKKAAEIEEVTSRLKMISDINAAFSGSGDHIKKLQSLYDLLMGHENISWEADKDWADRLKKYQR